MITVYTSHGSATCRKAVNYFKDKCINYVEKNIERERLSKDEIIDIIGRCENGAEDIISKRSNYYKKNGSVDYMKLSELVSVIQKNPTMLKRPIIIGKHKILIGYDDEEITIFREGDQ